MAKKVSNGSVSSNNSIFDIISQVDDSAEILSESRLAVIKDYIDTGSYILNAALTGSLFKGVPSGRCVVFAGSAGSGKSFLALSICRNAQKKGYIPIYLDSENAIDIETVKRIGCDPTRFVIKPVNTVNETSTFILKMVNKLLEVPEEERGKVMFVIDSIGNLTSNKERDDLTDGNVKQDMTRNKDIKAFFRTCLVPLGKIGAPLICTSHIYQTLDLYARTVVSGGTGIQFGNSLTMLLSTSKLEDKASEKIMENTKGEFRKAGVLVSAKAEKSRFTIPHVVKFQIPFFKEPNPYVGLEEYLTWENSGVVPGKIIYQKDYDKLSESDKQHCYEMVDKDNKPCYALEKENSRKIVVKHLGAELDTAELFTDKVFTEEVLKTLDETIIKPTFELPTHNDDDDIKELLALSSEEND